MIRNSVGNYRIVRELGVGGMGAVYEGLDQMLERPVAIKMLRSEIADRPELIERFRVEAIMLAKLNHPNIATLFSFFREGDDFYMVMEFVRGRTLESLLQAAGKLEPAQAAAILRQTLDAMSHAHRMGVLHRDIKPANIMVTGDGTVKVTDFGIARILGSSRMTREGRIIGTLEYIAPERVRGEEADIRSDLYSAGIVLFETLAGRLPFVSNTDYGLMEAHLHSAPPALGELEVKCPPVLEAILRRSIAKRPEDRFQSAEQFRDELAAVEAGVPAGVRTAVPATAKPTRLAGAEPRLAETRLAAPGPAGVSGGKQVKRWALAAAAAIVACGLGTAFWLHRGPAPAEPAAPAQTPPQLAPASVAPAPAPVEALPPAVAKEIAALPSVVPAVPSPAPIARRPVPVARIPDSVSTTALPPVSAPEKPAPERVTPPPAPTEVARLAPTPEVRPAPEPAPAAKTPAPRTLRDIRRIYIDTMPNMLDQFIREEIERQMFRRLEVVAEKKSADAIMTGNSEQKSGLGAKVTGGYLGMKSGFSGTVTIIDPGGNRILWSDEAGDKSAFVGILRRGGPKKVAQRLVSNLKEALE